MLLFLLKIKETGSKIYAQNFTEEILAINDHEFESNLSFVNPVTTNLEVKIQKYYFTLFQFIIYWDKPFLN